MRVSEYPAQIMSDGHSTSSVAGISLDNTFRHEEIATAWQPQEDLFSSGLPDQGPMDAIALELEGVRVCEKGRQLSLSSSDETDSQDSNYLKGTKKHPWTSAEDEQLRSLVAKLGAKDWGRIALEMNGRNGKQCHQRWNYFLNPSVRQGEWSKEEDENILFLQRQMGNKWAKISNHLPGRTGHAVKNRFHQISNSVKKRRGSSRSPRRAAAKGDAVKCWLQHDLRPVEGAWSLDSSRGAEVCELQYPWQQHPQHVLSSGPGKSKRTSGAGPDASTSSGRRGVKRKQPVSSSCTGVDDCSPEAFAAAFAPPPLTRNSVQTQPSPLASTFTATPHHASAHAPPATSASPAPMSDCKLSASEGSVGFVLPAPSPSLPLSIPSVPTEPEAERKHSFDFSSYQAWGVQAASSYECLSPDYVTSIPTHSYAAKPQLFAEYGSSEPHSRMQQQMQQPSIGSACTADSKEQHKSLSPRAPSVQEGSTASRPQDGDTAGFEGSSHELFKRLNSFEVRLEDCLPLSPPPGQLDQLLPLPPALTANASPAAEPAPATHVLPEVLKGAARPPSEAEQSLRGGASLEDRKAEQSTEKASQQVPEADSVRLIRGPSQVMDSYHCPSFLGGLKKEDDGDLDSLCGESLELVARLTDVDGEVLAGMFKSTDGLVSFSHQMRALAGMDDMMWMKGHHHDGWPLCPTPIYAIGEHATEPL